MLLVIGSDSCLEYHRQIDLFGLLNVVLNSSPLRIKRLVSGISISFKCECHIIIQIQYTKNLYPGRFELGTTLSYPNRDIITNTCPPKPTRNHCT